MALARGHHNALRRISLAISTVSLRETRQRQARCARYLGCLGGTSSTLAKGQSRFMSTQTGAQPLYEKTSTASALGYEVHVEEGGTGIILGFPCCEGKDFSLFHASWLWSNDPTHVHPSSGQRLRTPGQYPGAKINSVKLVPGNEEEEDFNPEAVKPIPPPPRGCAHPIGSVFQCRNGNSKRPTLMLRVSWEPNDHDEEFPTSYYCLEWLREWRYDDNALRERRQLSQVSSENALRHITKENESDGLIHIDYKALTEEHSDETRFELLHAIVRDGAALVKNAPLISSGPFAPVHVVGLALAGSLSHAALYGNIFHVQSIPDAHNIAYTSVPLSPHQDLAYYESAPGMQLLHCVSNHGIVGGESVLVDCFAAADSLRRISPRHFETLVQCPATFVKQRDGADMVYRRPHIVLQGGSTVDSMDGEIVSVTWSPPFEGPLSSPQELVEDYYEAYAAFERMLDNSLPTDRDDDVLPPDLAKVLREYAEEHTWERQLEPGELLVFNNRRMLHGRRGFSLAGSIQPIHGRHLVGAYTNIDDTLNEYRCLLRNKQDRHSYSLRNVGNGSSMGF